MSDKLKELKFICTEVIKGPSEPFYLATELSVRRDLVTAQKFRTTFNPEFVFALLEVVEAADKMREEVKGLTASSDVPYIEARARLERGKL